MSRGIHTLPPYSPPHTLAALTPACFEVNEASCHVQWVSPSGQHCGGPIHAHRVSFTSPPNPASNSPSGEEHSYIAAQSPQPLAHIPLGDCATFEKMLVQGIETGQGVFQFVSPLAHARSIADTQTLQSLPMSRETPLIDQLLQTIHSAHNLPTTVTPPSCLIAGRFNITIISQEQNSDSRSLIIQAEDIHDHTVRTLRLSQIALPFKDRVLSPDSIARAKSYLDDHLLALRKQCNQPRHTISYPVIASYAGIGRNAALITYNELYEQIKDGYVTRANLDDAFRRAIEQGRQVRGPRYVHSTEQEAAIKTALIRCIDLQEESGLKNIGPDSQPTDDLSSPVTKTGALQWGIHRIGIQILPIAPRYDIGLANKKLTTLDRRSPTEQQATVAPGPVEHNQRWLQAQQTAQIIEEITNQAHLPTTMFLCPTNTDSRAHRLALLGFEQLLSRRLNATPNTFLITDTALLCSALSIASSQDLLRAEQAFEYLSTLDLPQALVNISQQIETSSSNLNEHEQLASQAAHDAWRTLMILSDTPSELRMLKHVVATDVPTEQRKMLTTCLKAAKALSIQLSPKTPDDLYVSLISPIMINEIARKENNTSTAVYASLYHLAGQYVSDLDRGAVTAFRNNLKCTADDPYYQTVLNRLNKCQAWVKRLEKRRNLFQATVNPTSHKSPLQAIELGLQGADLGDIDKRKAMYLEQSKQAHHHVIESLTKEINQIEQELKSNRIDNQNAHRLAKQKQTITNQLQWVQQSYQEQQNQLGLSQPIDPADFKRLSKLAKSRPDYSDIKPHIRQMRQALYGESFKIDATSIESLCTGLTQLIEQMGSDSRIRLFDGGVVGVVTGGLTAAAGFATSLFLRPRLDLRYAGVRLATVELAKTSDFLEIVLGSVHKTQKRIAAGIAIGQKISGVINVSSGIDVIFKDWDDQHIDGICLQIPITGHRSKTQAEQAFTQLIFNLFQGLAADDVQDTLNNLLHKHQADDLSISVLESANDASSQRGIVIDGTLSVGSAIAKMGVSLEGRVMQQRSQRELRQISGERRITKKVSGQSVRLQTGVRANVKFGEALDAGFNPGYGTVDGLGFTAELARAGITQRWESRDKNATMKKTFYEREFVTFKDFTKELNTNRQDWIDALRRMTPDAGDQEIDAFLQCAAGCEGAGRSFAMRFEMYEEIRTRLNAIESVIELLAKNKASDECLALEDHFKHQRDRLIKDPRCYQPSSLRVYSKSELTRDQGITLGLVAARRQTVEAVHVPASMTVYKK